MIIWQNLYILSRSHNPKKLGGIPKEWRQNTGVENFLDGET